MPSINTWWVGYHKCSHLLSVVVSWLRLPSCLTKFMGVPKDQLSQLGSYHEIAAQFKTIGGAAFGFMLPVLQVTLDSQSLKNQVWYQGFVAGCYCSRVQPLVVFHLLPGGELTSLPVSSVFLGALVGGFLAGGVILVLRKALCRSSTFSWWYPFNPSLAIAWCWFDRILDVPHQYSNGCYQYWS